MILQVTTLDGQISKSVSAGTEYLVPCVWGIPVICPSHIDEGTDIPTGRHWHTDDRFGALSRSIKWWSKETQDKLNMTSYDAINAGILIDSGQPVVLEKKTASKNTIDPSGGAFTSVCWLYQHLGHLDASEGHCVHHKTPLVEQDDCLVCPAHSLKYNRDGSPRYKPPFFISIQYIDMSNKICQIRKPVQIDEKWITYKVNGKFDPFPLIALEDSNQEVIMDYRSKVSLNDSKCSFDVNLGAWPSFGMCPSLVKSDPRKVN